MGHGGPARAAGDGAPVNSYGGKVPQVEITTGTIYGVIGLAAVGFLTLALVGVWGVLWIIGHLPWVP